MATGRINKKVLDHIAAINKEAKQIELSKNLKKVVVRKLLVAASWLKE